MVLIFLETTNVTDMDPDLIITSLSPIIYTVMVILAFITIGKALYNGDGIKSVMGQLALIAFICFVAYKPVVLREFGALLYGIISTFTDAVNFS
jgi:hypothetical protein